MASTTKFVAVCIWFRMASTWELMIVVVEAMSHMFSLVVFVPVREHEGSKFTLGVTNEGEEQKSKSHGALSEF